MQRSRAWMLGALAAVAATPAAGASAAPWARGDVFAGIRGGQYKVYDNGGTLKDTIATGDSGEATGCAVTPNGVYGTLFAGGGIPLIDINDPHAVKTTYPATRRTRSRWPSPATAASTWGTRTACARCSTTTRRA